MSLNVSLKSIAVIIGCFEGDRVLSKLLSLSVAISWNYMQSTFMFFVLFFWHWTKMRKLSNILCVRREAVFGVLQWTFPMSQTIGSLGKPHLGGGREGEIGKQLSFRSYCKHHM